MYEEKEKDLLYTTNKKRFKKSATKIKIVRYLLCIDNNHRGIINRVILSVDLKWICNI